jgi:hypothetical protein
MPAQPWHKMLVRTVTAIWLLAAPAAIIGFSRRGCPLWPPARALFVPAGFALISNALLVLARIDRGYEKPYRLARRPTAFCMTVAGVGMVGVGANYLHRAAGFRALAAPAAAGFALWGLALMIFGRRAITPKERERPKGAWRYPRAMGIGLLVLGSVGVAAALSAIDISRDGC